MEAQINRLIDLHQSGRMSRRQLIGQIATLAAAVAGVSAADTPKMPRGSTFEATGFDHLALRVTDLDRSQRFYEEHLGMRLRDSRPNIRFLDCGEHFVALFRGRQAGLDHLCFRIPDYSQEVAVQRLRERGVEPVLREERTYFRDPDGIELQVDSV